ncbi:HlyD family secretion protein [Chitinophaga ginsengisoli]|uniref:Membrane fusion protein (Multidrug efflux system) n=1 Tax=Chitinophaga ginsengisoli TaxID=363837 RepID=A0A2P8FMZ0_9BACT|nr:HlyD family secretion protein [Chitinophaga ginsengisoli]PSL23081.1 membrane fusion protein (multidrug efflux system) [Chitinophaga ginsengisoli]
MSQTHNKTSARISQIIMTSIAVIIILIAVIYFYKMFNRTRHFEETNDAQVEAYINPVSARAAGYIQQILFEENQWVNKGDTLVILDDREYRNKVQEAEAALQDSHAQELVLDASISAAESGTHINQDQISSAQARLWQQQQDIKRYENLVKEEAATGQEYEQVKARYDVAKSELNAANNTLKTSYSKIEELRSRKSLLTADLKRKQTQLDFARINLGYTVIIAPYSGRLGRKVIQEGQQIQAGQPLVSIVNEKSKWITANFKETQMSAMQEGKPVDITIDAIPGRVFKGRITSISPSTGAKFSLLPPDNSTGNFVKIAQRIPVKIAFVDTTLAAVKVGMNAVIIVKK